MLSSVLSWFNNVFLYKIFEPVDQAVAQVMRLRTDRLISYMFRRLFL